jgi:hypothetical protein
MRSGRMGSSHPGKGAPAQGLGRRADCRSGRFARRLEAEPGNSVGGRKSVVHVGSDAVNRQARRGPCRSLRRGDHCPRAPAASDVGERRACGPRPAGCCASRQHSGRRPRDHRIIRANAPAVGGFRQPVRSGRRGQHRFHLEPPPGVAGNASASGRPPGPRYGAAQHRRAAPSAQGSRRGRGRRVRPHRALRRVASRPSSPSRPSRPSRRLP